MESRSLRCLHIVMTRGWNLTNNDCKIHVSPCFFFYSAAPGEFRTFLLEVRMGRGLLDNRVILLLMAMTMIQ